MSTVTVSGAQYSWDVSSSTGEGTLKLYSPSGAVSVTCTASPKQSIITGNCGSTTYHWTSNELDDQNKMTKIYNQDKYFSIQTYNSYTISQSSQISFSEATEAYQASLLTADIAINSVSGTEFTDNFSSSTTLELISEDTAGANSFHINKPTSYDFFWSASGTSKSVGELITIETQEDGSVIIYPKDDLTSNATINLLIGPTEPEYTKEYTFVVKAVGTTRSNYYAKVTSGLGTTTMSIACTAPSQVAVTPICNRSLWSVSASPASVIQGGISTISVTTQDTTELENYEITEATLRGINCTIVSNSIEPNEDGFTFQVTANSTTTPYTYISVAVNLVNTEENNMTENTFYYVLPTAYSVCTVSTVYPVGGSNILSYSRESTTTSGISKWTLVRASGNESLGGIYEPTMTDLTGTYSAITFRCILGYTATTTMNHCSIDGATQKIYPGTKATTYTITPDTGYELPTDPTE